MSERLPIAIVLPHSSLAIPAELTDSIALTADQIFNESDAYTELIYDFRERVLHWLEFPYARSIIDVNRPTGAHKLVSEGDGVIKHSTSYGASVFKPGKEPDAKLENHLIEKYWKSWHQKMAEIVADERVKLVLDCHSMAAVGPPNTSFSAPSSVRPRVSASNFGDSEGNQEIDGFPISASPELTRFAGEKFGEALADIPELAPTTPVAINLPFQGGYQILEHGHTKQPWIMIELSRAMYIGEQTGDSPIVPPDETRIALLRERIWQAIESIVETL